jgi:hypothetical protein
LVTIFHNWCPINLATIASAGNGFKIFLRFPMYLAHSIHYLINNMPQQAPQYKTTAFLVHALGESISKVRFCIVVHVEVVNVFGFVEMAFS